ncbi:uncharacterized protein FOMMEDRAFT_157970 [Fomitiporia mediterranea MF3/22]|uniref:uncharacterized protein n=1 Tax=Fomitiporia mediterranea (strain MF3/22) TaxID=694068 RepID=UPI0004408449|nr:uncharacterized protein FOMMEDRAFT_157970 [Fomitiporia mediterranea MF3/22]EJD00859.1 hypothetical protein FOMMEDRAFT_157970 [Fomitiporia mediterranea MF3/22]
MSGGVAALDGNVVLPEIVLLLMLDCSVIGPDQNELRHAYEFRRPRRHRHREHRSPRCRGAQRTQAAHRELNLSTCTLALFASSPLTFFPHVLLVCLARAFAQE